MSKKCTLKCRLKWRRICPQCIMYIHPWDSAKSENTQRYWCENANTSMIIQQRNRRAGNSISVLNIVSIYIYYIQYIPRNMHTVFALLCFVVVIHWLIFPYPSGLLHWHCGNLMIAPVPAKQPWWIWINTPCEFIINDCTTTTKQSTTKPCAYFLGYTVYIYIYMYIIYIYCQHGGLLWPDPTLVPRHLSLLKCHSITKKNKKIGVSLKKPNDICQNA